MLQRLKGLLSSESQPTRVFECRRCGSSVTANQSECPVCGAAEIACYEIA